eukprot:scaffold7720_cov129-Isochrysis_galbana.AAC.7
MKRAGCSCDVGIIGGSLTVCGCVASPSNKDMSGRPRVGRPSLAFGRRSVEVWMLDAVSGDRRLALTAATGPCVRAHPPYSRASQGIYVVAPAAPGHGSLLVAVAVAAW